MLTDIREKVRPEGRAEVYHNGPNVKSVDLRSDLEKDFPRAVEQTRSIAAKFAGNNAYDATHNVHKFLRENIIYLKDDDNNQILKAPSVFIHDLFGDCKSFSQFGAAILHNLGYPVAYKYASYKDSSPSYPTPSHVYVVVFDGDGYITLDGTNPAFNVERKPDFFLIKKLPVMKVTSLSDENLSLEAAQDYFKRMCAMSPQDRVNFLKQFSLYNQDKILRALRSVAKMADLDNVTNRNTPGQNFYTNAPGQWGTWSETFNRSYGSPYAQGWTGGSMAVTLEALADEYLADEYLAGKFGSKLKDFFQKVGSALAKPFLAPFRGAFLGLVKSNVKGLADKLWKAWMNGGSEKITNVWEGFGGEISRLKKAANFEAKVAQYITGTLMDDLKAMSLFAKTVRPDDTSKAPSVESDNMLSMFNILTAPDGSKIFPDDVMMIYRLFRPIGDRKYVFKSKEYWENEKALFDRGEDVPKDSMQNYIMVFEKDRKIYYKNKSYDLPGWFLFGATDSEEGMGQGVAAGLALAGTILGAMVAAIKPFLNTEDGEEMDRMVTDANNAAEGEESGLIERVVDWVNNHPGLKDMSETGIDALERLFENDPTGAVNTGYPGSGSGSGSGSGGSEVPWYVWLGGGGLLFYALKKK